MSKPKVPSVSIVFPTVLLEYTPITDYKQPSYKRA